MKKSLTKISIIVTTYNDELFIAEAISSIKRQLKRLPELRYEIIVINNNSTDSTSRILETLNESKCLTILNSKSNSGPSSARNKGIKSAAGEWVAFLDGDDYWLPERLDIMMFLVSNDKSVDIVFADALIEQDGVLTKTLQSSVMPPPKDTRNMLDHLFKRNCINMCAVLMKTDLARKVMFDENLRSAEDYDFWIRVSATGAKFAYINRPLVVYRRYGHSLSSNRLNSIDSTLTMLKKNEHLAFSATAKSNLKKQRIKLFEERIKVSINKNDLSHSISYLQNLRKLGKKEVCILFINKIAGFRVSNFLVKKLLY